MVSLQDMFDDMGFDEFVSSLHKYYKYSVGKEEDHKDNLSKWMEREYYFWCARRDYEEEDE